MFQDCESAQPGDSVLTVIAELPSLGLRTEMTFGLRHTNEEVVDLVEDLVRDAVSDFRGQVIHADDNDLAKIHALRERAQGSIEEWNTRARAVRDAEVKLDRARTQMADMRTTYLKELTVLREQLFRKETAEKKCKEFEPDEFELFSPEDYYFEGLDVDASRILKEKAEALNNKFLQHRDLCLGQFKDRVYDLTNKLGASRLLSEKKDLLLQKLLARQGFENEAEALKALELNDAQAHADVRRSPHSRQPVNGWISRIRPAVLRRMGSRSNPNHGNDPTTGRQPGDATPKTAALDPHRSRGWSVARSRGWAVALLAPRQRESDAGPKPERVAGRRGWSMARNRMAAAAAFTRNISSGTSHGSAEEFERQASVKVADVCVQTVLKGEVLERPRALGEADASTQTDGSWLTPDLATTGQPGATSGTGSSSPRCKPSPGTGLKNILQRHGVSMDPPAAVTVEQQPSLRSQNGRKPVAGGNQLQRHGVSLALPAAATVERQPNIRSQNGRTPMAGGNQLATVSLMNKKKSLRLVPSDPDDAPLDSPTQSACASPDLEVCSTPSYARGSASAKPRRRSVPA